jgi:hypothetical protein
MQTTACLRHPAILKDEVDVARYQRGDYVKVELTDERTGQKEWLWVRVDSCHEENQIVFGWVDNLPIINTDLKLGQHLAISCSNTRGHKAEADFNP